MDLVAKIIVWAGAALLIGIIVIGILLIAAMLITGVIALIGSALLRHWWTPPWTSDLASMIDDFG